MNRLRKYRHANPLPHRDLPIVHPVSVQEREKRRCGRSFVYIGLQRAAEWRVKGNYDFCRDMIQNSKDHESWAVENGHRLP